MSYRTQSMEAIVMTGGIRKMGSSVSTYKSHTVKIIQTSFEFTYKLAYPVLYIQFYTQFLQYINIYKKQSLQFTITCGSFIHYAGLRAPLTAL